MLSPDAYASASEPPLLFRDAALCAYDAIRRLARRLRLMPPPFCRRYALCAAMPFAAHADATRCRLSTAAMLALRELPRWRYCH